MNKIKVTIYILIFFLGFLVGILGSFVYTKIIYSSPTVRITGTVIQGTESHPNLYLNSPIYLENSTLPDNRIYLKFQDDNMMNLAIGKRACLDGYIRTVDIGDDQVVVEFLVTGVQLLGEEGN
ncbi:MAG: hypothetical protein APR63_05315 [Desulfuromonas sp. SDB]|nr:MAG: hypothetical protein APR63_05315 [Desulfuromonas sp. SDB]